MKLSKLQDCLQKIKEEFGDCDVCIAKDNTEFQDIIEISYIGVDEEKFLLLANFKLP